VAPTGVMENSAGIALSVEVVPWNCPALDVEVIAAVCGCEQCWILRTLTTHIG